MCEWCVNCGHYGGEPLNVINSKGWCDLYKIAKSHWDECEGEGYKLGDVAVARLKEEAPLQ